MKRTKEELKDELKNKISMELKDPTLQIGFETICKEKSCLKYPDLVLIRSALNDNIKSLTSLIKGLGPCYLKDGLELRLKQTKEVLRNVEKEMEK